MLFKDTQIWKTVLDNSGTEQEISCKSKLVNAYDTAWGNGTKVAQLISSELPGLTLHDENHFNALFRCASLLLGEQHDLNPLEVFIFGMSVLIHDIGHTTVVYQGGNDELKNTDAYKDAVALTDDDDAALFIALRQMHAEQAVEVLNFNFSRDNDISIFLLEDNDLRISYGHHIGKIAASHHWDREKVLSELTDSISAPTGYPSNWEIRPKLIALLLRCADAIQIDRSRAPLFAKTLHNPNGLSKLHWNAQGKLLFPVISKENYRSLQFSSNSPFGNNDIESWWIAYDLCNVANDELVGCSKILNDLNYPSFTVDNVLGASSPERLSNSIEVKDWSPIDAEIKITNTKRIIDLFGGNQLYGHDPIVPLREAIQNAADAIRAKDAKFTNTIAMENKIVIEVTKQDEDVLFRVSDTGIGMSKQVLTGPLIEFGKSLWNSNDLITEHPGLLSKKISQKGRYGIGFFSYFMLSNYVKVTSHAIGDNTAHSIEFNDTSLRPVLREVPIEQLNGFSSTIEFSYPISEYKKLLKVVRHFHKSHLDITIQQRIGSLCATVPYDIHVIEDGNIEKVHLNDWHLEESKDWLKKILFNNQLDLQPEDQRKVVELNSDLLTTFVAANNPNEVIGRAAIALSNFNVGNFAVGGFCENPSARDLKSFLGILPLEPTGPSRINGQKLETEPSLDVWASEQAARIAVKNVDPGYRLHAAAYVSSFGGDPLPIAACILNGNVAELSEVVSTVKGGEELYFPVRLSKNDGKAKIENIMIRITANSSIGVSFNNVNASKNIGEAHGFGNDFEDYYHVDFTSNQITFADHSLIGCVERFLNKEKIAHEIVFQEDAYLGTYKGPSSEREGIKEGQNILVDCLVIKPIKLAGR